MNSIWITKATYTSEFRISLTFSDGTQGEADLKEFLNTPIFEPLTDKEYFQTFKLNDWTIEWENGADFAPEFLHQLVKKNETISA